MLLEAAINPQKKNTITKVAKAPVFVFTGVVVWFIAIIVWVMNI